VTRLADDRYLIHWPLAFKPGNGQFPKDDNNKVILDKETTIADVSPTYLLTSDRD
jgi:hypothetical protein